MIRKLLYSNYFARLKKISPNILLSHEPHFATTILLPIIKNGKNEIIIVGKDPLGLHVEVAQDIYDFVKANKTILGIENCSLINVKKGQSGPYQQFGDGCGVICAYNVNDIIKEYNKNGRDFSKDIKYTCATFPDPSKDNFKNPTLEEEKNITEYGLALGEGLYKMIESKMNNEMNIQMKAKE